MKDTTKTYTLEDLYSWEIPENKEYAVIGHPIDHSLSPRMFNVAFEKMGQKLPFLKGCRYYKFDIEPEDLKEAIELFHEKGFAGINVTAPLKQLLRADGFPTNKLTWTESDGYATANTDIGGFLRMKLEHGKDLHDLLQLPVILVGAGGLAKSVAYAALSAGCKDLTIYNRSGIRAMKLAKELQDLHPDADIRVVTVYENLIGSFRNFLINASSLGVNPDDPSPVPLSFIDHYKIEYVLDLTYGEHDSMLLQYARKRNIPCQNGEELLISQGAIAFHGWTRVQAEDVYPIMRGAVTIPYTIKDRYAELNNCISEEFRRLMKHVGFTKKAIDYCLPSEDKLTTFSHDYLTSIINQLHKIADKAIDFIQEPARHRYSFEEDLWEKFANNESVFREWIENMTFCLDTDFRQHDDYQDMEASLEDMLDSVRNIIDYACDDSFLKLSWGVRVSRFFQYLSFRKLFKMTHYDWETHSRRPIGVLDVLLP